jgi:plasmid replication initiation protein
MSEKNGKSIVVMHNNLARHQVVERLASLSVQDQRVIAYLIAHGIDHTKNELPVEIEGGVTDLAKACGISGGNIYQQVKAALDSLLGHRIAFRDPDDGSDFATVWLCERNYYEGEGRFRCAFPPKLRRVLTDLHAHRTEMDLEILLGLGGGSYAHRLYTLAKSWESAKGWMDSIEKLRGQLGVPDGAYGKTANFLAMCIAYPLKAINAKSDIHVEYKPVKRGRKITGIQFSVKSQKRGENRANARVIDPKNPQQITDLPEPEQLQAWAWIRTNLVAGTDLPETMDWSHLKMSRADALKYWIAEKNQIKMPFA